MNIDKRLGLALGLICAVGVISPRAATTGGAPSSEQAASSSFVLDQEPDQAPDQAPDRAPDGATDSADVANGQVTTVVLYRDGGEVTRQIPLAKGVGERFLIIDNLPAGLREDSLILEGADGVDVRNVQLIASHAELAARHLPEMSETHRRLEDEKATNQHALDATRQQLEFLAKLESFAASHAAAETRRGTLSATDVTKLAGYAFDQRSRLVAEVDRLERERRALLQRQQGLKTERDRRKAALRARGHRARLHIFKSVPAPAELRLRYLVDGVSWSPTYVIRADGEAVVVRAGAKITQGSGENWRDVALTLTSGSRSSALARRIPQPLPVELRRGGHIDKAVRMSSQLSEIQTPRRPGGGGLGRVHESQLAAPDVVVDVDVPGRVSLRTSAATQRVMLGDYALPAERYFVAVPLENHRVSREARVRNDTGRALLRGSAEVYFANEFVGTTTLDTVLPGDDFVLALGVARDVKASRRLVERDERWRGNAKEITLHYALAIENRSGIDLPLRLFDRVPHSATDDALKLDITTPKMPLSTVDSDAETTRGEGILRWDVVVPPQEGRTEQWTLEYHYTLALERSFHLQLATQTPNG